MKKIHCTCYEFVRQFLTRVNSWHVLKFKNICLYLISLNKDFALINVMILYVSWYSWVFYQGWINIIKIIYLKCELRINYLLDTTVEIKEAWNRIRNLSGKKNSQKLSAKVYRKKKNIYRHGLLKVSNRSCIELEKKEIKPFMRKFTEKVMCELGLQWRGENLVAGEWWG